MKNKTLAILMLALLSNNVSANEIQKTTVGKYAKNGLAVNLTYTTEKVEVGERSEVNLTLTTSLTEGELKVKLLSVDKDLDGINTKLLTFHPSSEDQSFPIKLKLSSDSQGKHYLDVHVTMEDKGRRVFVVPITVGKVIKKSLSPKIQKASTQELVSVSKAVETIR